MLAGPHSCLGGLGFLVPLLASRVAPIPWLWPILSSKPAKPTCHTPFSLALCSAVTPPSHHKGDRNVPLSALIPRAGPTRLIPSDLCISRSTPWLPSARSPHQSSTQTGSVEQGESPCLPQEPQVGLATRPYQFCSRMLQQTLSC